MERDIKDKLDEIEQPIREENIMASIPLTSEIFATTTFLETYWFPKVGITTMRKLYEYRSCLEWLNWISKLQRLVMFLPDITERC